MQSDCKQIYKELSIEKGKSEQMYKDLGAFVFHEAYTMLNKPASLITKLRGVGSWHLRKKRMEIIISEFAEGIVDQWTSEPTLQIFKERRDRCNIFKARLKDYEKYIELKHNIRRVRYKTQPLLKQDHEGKYKSE